MSSDGITKDIEDTDILQLKLRPPFHFLKEYMVQTFLPPVWILNIVIFWASTATYLHKSLKSSKQGATDSWNYIIFIRTFYPHSMDQRITELNNHINIIDNVSKN